MTNATDDDLLRDALSPLRQATPAHGAAGRALQAVNTVEARPRRVTVPRTALAVTAAAALGVGVLAALPTSDSAPAGIPALQSAAAAAAQLPAPAGGYRYVKVVDRWTYAETGNPPRTIAFSVPSELWIDRQWKGRIVTGESYDITENGKPSGPQGPLTRLLKPGTGPYVYGDGPLAGLNSETLPTNGPAVDAFFADLYAKGNVVQEERPYDALRSKLTLLTQANTTARQRAALFSSLAATPGIVDRGEGKDPTGRPGHVVEVPVTHAGAATITVVFDPATSEVLSWTESLRAGNGGIPGQEHVFLTAGHVDALEQRP